MSRSRVAAWLPVLVWAAVIFTLSSIPHLGTDLGVWDLILRKGAHMTEYAILAGLLLRALGSEPAAFLAAVAYAVSDEFHQHFVSGRHASAVDVAIDAVGALAGVLLAARAYNSRSWPNGSSSTTASSTSSSSASTASSTRFTSSTRGSTTPKASPGSRTSSEA